MQFIVEIEVDVPDVGTATQWAGAVISLARNCTVCRGAVWLKHPCAHCNGSGQEPGEHPYRPRVLGARRGAP